MPHKLDVFNNLFVLVFTLIFLLPILFIFINLFSPSTEVWIHIKIYLLQEYVTNSLIIVFFVGLFTILIGTTLAWIVSMYEFPGVKIFKWMLVPMAIHI